MPLFTKTIQMNSRTLFDVMWLLFTFELTDSAPRLKRQRMRPGPVK